MHCRSSYEARGQSFENIDSLGVISIRKNEDKLLYLQEHGVELSRC